MYLHMLCRGEGKHVNMYVHELVPVNLSVTSESMLVLFLISVPGS